MTEQEARKIVKEAGVKMLEQNLVQGTWGNISLRISEDKMLVTPSAMDYIRMTPEDLVVVDINTLEYDPAGPKPTSEKKIHAAVYRTHPEATAVMHSHPSYGCSLASARVELPIINDEMKDLIGTSVLTAKYGLPGTKGLTNAVVEAMQGRKACFAANHGVFACGKDMDEAFEIYRVLENAAKQYIEQECAKKLGKEQVEEGDLEILFNKIYKKYAIYVLFMQKSRHLTAFLFGKITGYSIGGKVTTVLPMLYIVAVIL